MEVSTKDLTRLTREDYTHEGEDLENVRLFDSGPERQIIDRFAMFIEMGDRDTAIGVLGRSFGPRLGGASGTEIFNAAERLLQESIQRLDEGGEKEYVDRISGGSLRRW